MPASRRFACPLDATNAGRVGRTLYTCRMDVSVDACYGTSTFSMNGVRNSMIAKPLYATTQPGSRAKKAQANAPMSGQRIAVDNFRHKSRFETW